MEEGSRAGRIFATIGGFFNMAVMVFLIIRLVLLSVRSIKLENPPYFEYFIFLFFVFYFGILGLLIFFSVSNMSYSFSTAKGAKLCLIYGIMSLNVFAIFGGIFGGIDGKDLKENRSEETKIKVNPNF